MLLFKKALFFLFLTSIFAHLPFESGAFAQVEEEWEVVTGWVAEKITDKWEDKNRSGLTLRAKSESSDDHFFTSWNKPEDDGDSLWVQENRSKLTVIIKGKSATFELIQKDGNPGFRIQHHGITLEFFSIAPNEDGVSQFVNLRFPNDHSTESLLDIELSKLNSAIKEKHFPKLEESVKVLSLAPRNDEVQKLRPVNELWRGSREYALIELGGLHIFLQYKNAGKLNVIHIDRLSFRFERDGTIDSVPYHESISPLEKYRRLNKIQYYDWVPERLIEKDQYSEGDWTSYINFPSVEEIELEGKGVILRQYFDGSNSAIEIEDEKYGLQIMPKTAEHWWSANRKDFLFKFWNRDILCKKDCLIEAHSIDDLLENVEKGILEIELDTYEPHFLLRWISKELELTYHWGRSGQLGERYLQYLEIDGKDSKSIWLEFLKSENLNKVSRLDKIFID